MAGKKKSWKETKTTLVEISDERLKKLLASADLKVGKDIRLVKGLSIRPGSIVAKQYDR